MAGAACQVTMRDKTQKGYCKRRRLLFRIFLGLDSPTKAVYLEVQACRRLDGDNLWSRCLVSTVRCRRFEWSASLVKFCTGPFQVIVLVEWRYETITFVHGEESEDLFFGIR